MGAKTVNNPYTRYILRAFAVSTEPPLVLTSAAARLPTTRCGTRIGAAAPTAPPQTTLHHLQGSQEALHRLQALHLAWDQIPVWIEQLAAQRAA